MLGKVKVRFARWNRKVVTIGARNREKRPPHLFFIKIGRGGRGVMSAKHAKHGII